MRTTLSAPTIVRTVAELHARLKQYRSESPAGTVGLVPTMGYLHEGHASLLRRSASENGFTVLSVFVNPLQFGPTEDLDRYPRDEERDRAVAAEAGADLIFMPSVSEMYPKRPLTTISLTGVTEGLCGASRPGHFDGVAIVVAKLFNLVRPERAYFGLKDAQQLAVITQMVEDLNFPVEVVPCPIVRESSGLALSSRNVYLSTEEKEQALVLSRTLKQVPEWVKQGISAKALTSRIREAVSKEPLADIDYVEAVDYPSLAPIEEEANLSASRRVLVAVAVRFGKTRLIDNILLPQA